MLMDPFNPLRKDVTLSYAQLLEYHSDVYPIIITINLLFYGSGLFQISAVMLGYRGYLQDSRARRGITDLPVHYQQGEPGSNEDIKELASNPNFGEIFYSDGKPAQLNTHLKSSLKTEIVRNEQLGQYMRHLEEENQMLKTKLAQFLQGQSANPNNRTIYGNSAGQGGQGAEDYFYLINAGDRQYITSSLPSQNYIPEQPGYQHAPQFSFTNPTFNTGRGQPQPQPRQTLPNPNTNSQNSLYQPPIIPQQVSTQYISQQQLYSPTIQPTQPIPTLSYQYNPNTNPTSPRNQNRNNLINMARQKLYQIKEDDEELRMYTIRLLNRPG